MQYILIIFLSLPQPSQLFPHLPPSLNKMQVLARMKTVESDLAIHTSDWGIYFLVLLALWWRHTAHFTFCDLLSVCLLVWGQEGVTNCICHQRFASFGFMTR